MKNNYDVIIIGSGPAGLMAAVETSKHKRVLVIEKNSTPGKKLLITGGGRCNLTNLKENRLFLENVDYNKKYLYSSITKFGPQDIYDYFISNGVQLKEEKDNQIFPVSNKSKDILAVLINNSKNAEFKYHEIVTSVKRGEVITNKGTYKTKNIIIATGGSSFKQTGSSGDNMIFAKMLNQPTIDLFPAETSIFLKEKNELAGTAVEEVIIKFLKKQTNGNLIFTHKGLSGSSIMKMSEHIYKNIDQPIIIDLLPSLTKKELSEIFNNYDRNKNLSSFLNIYFTKRFSNYLIEKLKLNQNTLIKQINNKQKENLLDTIKNLTYYVKSVDNIDNAYVTGGGINMKYIDSTSMESKINPNIYFVGEALDVHGPIGGYNITLALSTGYLAANNINHKKN